MPCRTPSPVSENLLLLPGDVDPAFIEGHHYAPKGQHISTYALVAQPLVDELTLTGRAHLTKAGQPYAGALVLRDLGLTGWLSKSLTR